jgi:hypothetical protein
MTFSLNPNWSEWARVSKAVGGFATAVGVALGAISPIVAPLASIVPALAPAADIITAFGLLVHGLGTGAKAMLESLTAAGLVQGPK